MIRLIFTIVLLCTMTFADQYRCTQSMIKAHTEVFGDAKIDPFTSNVHGTLSMDKTPLSLTGTITIKAHDLESDNKLRDKHMYETLQTKKYPLITFTIQKVQKAPNGLYRLHGILKLHGVARTLDVPAHITQDTQGVHILSKFSIKMTQFRIVPPKLFFLHVRNKVDILADLHLVRG